jgi:multiple sugar transport system ATP-binding protein
VQVEGMDDHMVVRAHAEHDARVGEQITVHLPPASVYLFNDAGQAFRRVKSV